VLISTVHAVLWGNGEAYTLSVSADIGSAALKRHLFFLEGLL
jgi:hypothetical protein